MIAHFFDYETELEFEYADCDSYENEIGELYSYTENPEFNVNKTSFEEFLQSTGSKIFSVLTAIIFCAVDSSNILSQINISLLVACKYICKL